MRRTKLASQAIAIDSFWPRTDLSKCLSAGEVIDQSSSFS
jgi:hypothetical protein